MSYYYSLVNAVPIALFILYEHLNILHCIDRRRVYVHAYMHHLQYIVFISTLKSANYAVLCNLGTVYAPTDCAVNIILKCLSNWTHNTCRLNTAYASRFK